jgi:hypothetical protein
MWPCIGVFIIFPLSLDIPWNIGLGGYNTALYQFEPSPSDGIGFALARSRPVSENGCPILGFLVILWTHYVEFRNGIPAIKPLLRGRCAVTVFAERD